MKEYARRLDRLPVSPEVLPVEKAPEERDAATLTAATIQSVHGNSVLSEGLFGESPDLLSQFLAEQVAYGAAGVQGTVPGGGDVSNQAMLALMAETRGQDADVDHPAVAMIGRMSGRPLPEAVLTRMNAVFEHDFSHVRVHTSGTAAEASDALNAHAFTVGADIYFGPGEFKPGTTEGDRLIAHELTHVQQDDEGRLGAPTGDGLDVSSPTDSTELEAYSKADTVVAELQQAPTPEAGAPESSAPDLSAGGLSVEAAGPVSDVGGTSTETTEASADSGLAQRETNNTSTASGDEENTEGIDVAAALEEGLSSLEQPSNLAPVKGEVAPAPTLVEGGALQESAPAEITSQEAPTQAGVGAGEELTAPIVAANGAGLQISATPATASEVPEVQTAHGDFTTAMDTLREQISTAVTTQKAAVTSAADAAKAAIEAAAAAMRESVTAAFEATRTLISENAETTRENLRTELETRKEELTTANTDQKQRVLDTSKAHQETLTTLYTDLATAARTHGTEKAEELKGLATTQAAAATQAGATVASQYASHDRANDIRLTCTKMAAETASKITSEIAGNAGQLTTDGNDLAEKLIGDGTSYVENIKNGDADTTTMFDDALSDALETLDDGLEDSIEQVDDAEEQSLDQVDELEESVQDQLDDVSDGQTDGIDSIASDATKAVDDAGQRALDALEEQVAQVEEWLASAHPSQWPMIVDELNRVRDELNTKGATVVEGLGALGTSICTQVTEIGATTVTELESVPTDLQPHLDEITTGFGENLTSIEETWSTTLGQQVTDFTTTWTTEADNKITDLDSALQEGQDGLNKTSTDGLAEIDKKVTESTNKMSEMLSTLNSELSSKAEEIANQSAWDRFVSGLKNFALGLWDALVDFAKTLLIVALVILAIVIVVAIIILIVAGAEVLLAVAAAVVAFVAAAAEIIAIVCLILTVLSVVMAIVSVISAWSNPNLTSDEKWRATGKGVGDIALEFLPDFGISLLTKADDASDAARAIENAGDLINQADNLNDAGKAIENAGDVARTTEKLSDVADSATDVAKVAENAQDGVNTAENAVKAADAIPVKAVDDVPTNTPKVKQNATTNSVDEPVSLVDDAAAKHILDGDGPGSGGHRFGTGEPGKTEFPQHWSDQDILHHASDIATDSKAVPGANNSPKMFDKNGDPIRNTYFGVRDGVIVKVVVEPATGKIVTAYPVPPGSKGVPAVLNDTPNLRPITPNPEVPKVNTPEVPKTNTPETTTNTPETTTNTPETTTNTPETSNSTGGTTNGTSSTADTPKATDGFNPENAPEWLKRYQQAAEEKAKAEGIVRPRLQAAYDLFKGFAMSSYQAVNGSGLVSDDGFIQNIGIIWTSITGWLDSGEEKKKDLGEQ